VAIPASQYSQDHLLGEVSFIPAGNHGRMERPHGYGMELQKYSSFEIV
jgi:hypothetical protein